jgi:thymidylate kinase
VANQGKFYDRFDAVVLLSVPVDVLLHRIESRSSNDFGKSPDERARILQDLEAVEPLLRRTARFEIDTNRPLADVVDAVELVALGVQPVSSSTDTMLS